MGEPPVLEYEGIAYRQSVMAEAPWTASLVIPAEELLTWAAIPRRTESHLLGFQRAATPARVEAAKEFFRIPENQSPTALIVGLNPVDHGRKFEFEIDPEDMTGRPGVRRCKLRIRLQGWVDADLETLAHQVTDNLRARLQSEPDDSDDEGDDETTMDETDAFRTKARLEGFDPGGQTDERASMSDVVEHTEEGEDEDDAADDLRTEVELGQSVLGKLAHLLEDPEWVLAHEDLVRDLAKPATIIDGQHRVLGAAQCERMIPFAVCALIDCSWPEQVFQFTVVNYTATGIPDQFITANAALSLTGSELRGLEIRLVQAGVKVVEYELMRIVNFDDRSAFYDLVNLAERKDSSKIGYKTMVRIANMWHRGKTPVISASLLPNLYPDIKGNRRTYRRESLSRWQENDWGDFFIAFWDAVNAVYGSCESHEAGHHLWDVGHSQFTIAIVLHELQAAYMENLAAQDSSFFDVDKDDAAVAKSQLLAKVRNRAETFFGSNLPCEFFAKEWKTKSLSTGAGRIALNDAIGEMVKSRGKWVYANSSLVSGKTR
jgi:hypothetical protein